MQDKPAVSATAISSILRDISTSYRLFDHSSRLRINLLLGLLVIGAVLESVAAAVIVPFVAILNDPGVIQSQPKLRAIFHFFLSFGLDGEERAFIIFIALALIAFFLLKNLFLFLVSSLQFKFIYSQMPIFTSRLLHGTINQSVLTSGSRNSAELVRNVTNEVFMYFTNFLIPALTLLTEFLVLTAILMVLFLIAPGPSLVAVLVLGFSTALFYRSVKRRIREFGQMQQMHNAERIKWVNQIFGALKEIKVLDREKYFLRQFKKSDSVFAESARYAMLLSQTPRMFIETVAFVSLFLGVAIAMLMELQIGKVLPVLALFGVSAVRLLPSLNRILLSLTRMAYYRSSAQIVYAAEELRSKIEASRGPADYPVQGEGNRRGEWRELAIESLSFAYPGKPAVFENLSIKIPFGTSVALIGKSGSGKTTFGDILLGLLEPQSGVFSLDGIPFVPSRDLEWKRGLGYLPQKVFLLDDTVRRNVAIGVEDEDISDELVWKLLEIARIAEDVRKMTGGLDAIVGEDGNALSGGQRQRIGIARALYHQPNFLILDEATSALDNKTESEVSDMMDSLKGKVTLIVIAHREETIRRCILKYSIEKKSFI